MQTEDSDSIIQRGEPIALPTVGALRLITFDAPATLQRRHGPRRRLAGVFPRERRQADRRRAAPGIDGLLRVVLADDWK